MLMPIILVMANTKGMKGFGDIVIVWIEGLDIFFFAFLL
jgi:hypothetical protein